MYGLVHIGLRDLIQSLYGEDKWRDVFNHSELDEDIFVSMASYSDDVTYKLVGSAVKTLNLSADKLLTDFGHHWVLKTGPDAYGSILDMSGDSVPELLTNLDKLHLHLSNIMPDLKPPSFQCENITDNSMTIHYRSSRQGLTPMVTGLFKGIGERFNTPCTVELISSEESDSGSHVIFFLTWKSKQL